LVFLQGSFGGRCQQGYNYFIVINLFYMGACDHGCIYGLLSIPHSFTHTIFQFGHGLVPWTNCLVMGTSYSCM
jgi:hypothetical protein